MKKRPLRPEESLEEQFQALRQIGSLTAAQCREVVQLVREDEKGAATCKRQRLRHPKSFSCLRPLQIPSCYDEGVETAWMMSLPAVLQAKVEACPLYRKSMEVAMRKHNNHLTLILYQDEVSGGNILNPNQARKSNLTYFTWLEFPVLFQTEMWLTLGVTRSNEIKNMEAGMASLTRAMLSQIRAETVNGFAVDLGGAHEPSLCWIDKVILLMDHEAIRSYTGTKGASGLKCCIKCLNVLALHKAEAVWQHEDISCCDVAKFWPATDASVQAAANRLLAEDRIGKKKELEKLLGWNALNFLKGPLTAPDLLEWVSVEDIHFDTMHGYYSNGILPHELGCWWTFLQQNSQVTLTHLSRFAALWQRCPGTTASKHVSPEHLFNDKVWKEGYDYRGDAACSSLVLSLCVAFGQDILSEDVTLRAPLQSLEALYKVTLLLNETKRNISVVDQLLPAQKQHMMAFAEAYGSTNMRPKFHYVLHTTQQIKKFQRHIDCWPCERKHKVYKARACTNWVNAPHFSKGLLLELATGDLNCSLPMEKLGKRLLGKTKEQGSSSHDVHVMSKELEIGCVTYVAEQFILLSDTKAFHLHYFTQSASVFLAHGATYERMKRPVQNECFAVWKKRPQKEQFLPAEALEATNSPMYSRTNDDATVDLLL